MVLLKRVSLVFAALIVAAGVGWILIGPEWRALLAHQPYGRDVLFWNQAQRDAAVDDETHLAHLFVGTRRRIGVEPEFIEVGLAISEHHHSIFLG